MAVMHRTTIMLPLPLKRRARIQADRLGISLSELIRESLEASLEDRAGEAGEDALYGDDAVYDGPAPADLAADHDAYLYGDAPKGGSRDRGPSDERASDGRSSDRGPADGGST